MWILGTLRPNASGPSDHDRCGHFRPLRDFSRITHHIVMQCLRRGNLASVYRSIRANPAAVDDPSGEFSALPARQPARTP